MHQSTVILLLVLCTTLSTDAQPADVVPRYENFLNQHVYGNMNEHICDSEIGKRDIKQIVRENGKEVKKCKDKNTFIKANSDQVRSVCTGGGVRYGNSRDQYVSTNPFPVITCTLKRGERPPHCEYKRGDKSNRKIVVACDRGWPTHYEEGRIILN